MARIKTPEEIKIMREGGSRLSGVLRSVAQLAIPGARALDLDKHAEALIREGGDLPAFLHHKPDFARKSFPATLCVSINDDVVHGIPGGKVLQNGDIVGLDLGLKHENLYLDMAVTVGVGEISPMDKKLIEATKASLSAGLAKVRAGARLGDIGAEIEKIVNEAGFSVVRELGGHGVGHAVHEPPFVPHFGKAGTGERLETGQTIAIEPMVNVGRSEVIFDEQDGYTVRSADGSKSAHFEVTLAVTDKGAQVLTPIFW